MRAASAFWASALAFCSANCRSASDLARARSAAASAFALSLACSSASRLSNSACLS